MNRLARIIEGLDKEELELIRKDLEAGNLDKLVRKRLKEHDEQDLNKICPVCHTPIEEDSLTLIFGPAGLRKKASFCAMDCLEYFISRLKKEKEQQEKQPIRIYREEKE